MSENVVFSIIQPAYIRCGVHDKSLQQKKMAIQDSVGLVDEVLREIKSNQNWLGAVELASVLSWTTLMVTDIIQDAVKVEPTGRAKMVLMVLDQIKNKVGKSKFDNNRYNDAVDKIDKVSSALKAACPAAKDLVSLFTNMAKNTLGLADAMQSGEETRQSVSQSYASAVKQLTTLKKKISDINRKIADDMLTDDSGLSNIRSDPRGKVIIDLSNF